MIEDEFWELAKLAAGVSWDPAAVEKLRNFIEVNHALLLVSPDEEVRVAVNRLRKWKLI